MYFVTAVSMVALSSATGALAASQVKLVNMYKGKTFFDGWRVNASLTDLTLGNVHYVDEATAKADKLISVNSVGNAILKVDNVTNDPSPGNYSTFGRNTVMLISKDTINIGSLVILDAVHIPFGCSVWPAFWTLDDKNKDDGGEIDIVEPVNLMTTNQYSLHARKGCSLAPSNSFASSGKTIATNCDHLQIGNPGCTIQETASQNAAGSAFAKNGGGVYAMQWSTDGIQFWFFERSKIPSDITSDSPNPSSWGTPSAAFPASGCNPSTFFNPQSLILNIDVCGTYAGEPGVFANTGCSGDCTVLVRTASNYNDAYWEIKSIKTFTVAGGSGNSSVAGSPSGSAGSGAPTPSSPSSFVMTTPTWTGALIVVGSLVAGLFSGVL